MERNKREYDDDDDECVVLVGRSNDNVGSQRNYRETNFSQFNYTSGKGGTVGDMRARGDSEVEVLEPRIPRLVNAQVAGDSWSLRKSSGTGDRSGTDGSTYRPYTADTSAAPYSSSSGDRSSNSRSGSIMNPANGTSPHSLQQSFNQQGSLGIRSLPGELHCTALAIHHTTHLSA
jgi:hypothetical protein